MKKSIIKPLAFILSFVLMFQVLYTPLTASAKNIDTSSDTYSDTSLTDNNSDTSKPEIVREITSLREETVKHFELSNGNILAAEYESPVHYNNNGIWEDIDNTLSKESAADSEDSDGYSTKSNSFNVKFSKKSNSKKLVKIKKDDYQLSWGVLG